MVSEFVIPSMYWVEDQDEKNRLIEEFKSGVRCVSLTFSVCNHPVHFKDEMCR